MRGSTYTAVPPPSPPSYTVMACALSFFNFHNSLFFFLDIYAAATGVRCWRGMGKISWTDNVRNKEML